ncbi:unnamed protein product [Rhizoctonia solani]|uniref:Zn(2)-C6 fungal-type domain-containing protein n=1 Tax=Rhizoctonia solani TaxID=456999 RepID=A0A8H3GAN0_9AGAM|nr:unnamed protein product [Rhizoctonia solani]
MSQSEVGPSRRRSKYAPRACNVCRRRKCKCDGAFPVCRPCAASGYECSWVPEGDEDRPATKQLVEGLRAKVQLLEAEISQIKQDASIAASTSGARPDAEFSSVVPQPTNPSESISRANADPSASRAQVEHALLHPPDQAHPRLPLIIQPHADSTNSTLRPSHVQIQVASDQRPTTSNDLMATPVDIRPPYQYIFNISLNEDSPEHRPSLLCQWDRHLPNLGSIQLSRHEHDTLLFRCFGYGAAWLFGLFPDLFLRDMLESLKPDSTCIPGELQHYSPLLHCALLAFASPLSNNPVIQQPSTREKFATHAKRWLDEEFAYANPSLILSLILLSEYHLGVGESNTGHMYTGMSIRAVQAGTGSPLRDWYRWSAFVHENLLAQEMRRPSEMQVPMVPMLYPLALTFDRGPLSVDSDTQLFNHNTYSAIALECFTQSIKLMLIPTSVSTSTSGNNSTINDVHQQFDTWLNALPDNLIPRSETIAPPPVLALHIRYWWSILQLYLPISATEPSRDMRFATEKLFELFTAFDAQFGFRYFPRNLLKAVHICGRRLILERSPEDEIEACLKWLRTWPCAEHMVSDLIHLRSTTQTVNGITSA